MKQSLKKEIEIIMKEQNLNCSIEDFKDKLDWIYVSEYQKLSEEFIREFQDNVNWNNVSKYQKLSDSFIREFKDKVDIEIQTRKHKEKTLEQKEKEIKEYAKGHKLKYDNGILTAYREHDLWDRGSWNKTIYYEQGGYYRDWHCDMDENEEDSFGLGIWPTGNTEVEVKVEDWGVAVNKNDGKARVWGFKVV